MEEDVESTLAGLERRLRALQSEVDADRAEPEPRPRPSLPPLGRRVEEARATEPAPMAEPAPDTEDAFTRFDVALQRATRDLSTAWDRALAAAHGTAEGAIVRGEIFLEARADLPRLCALHRALSAITEVGSADLRAYAGGQAVLDVVVERPVALAERLREVLPLTVLEARPGRLSVALD